MTRLLLAAAALVAVPMTAMPAPPENADPALAPFFRSLKQPGTSISCCDISDCRPVKTRFHGDSLQVFIPAKDFQQGIDDWVNVPPGKMLTPRENPTGEPIACWNKWIGVLCYLNGAGL